MPELQRTRNSLEALTRRAAFFILDALAPITDMELTAAAAALAQALSALGAEVHVSRRLVDAP